MKGTSVWSFRRLRQVEAGHAGHGDVEQGQCKTGRFMRAAAFGDALQRLGRGGGADGVVAGVPEHGADVIEKEGIVVDQQYQPAGGVRAHCFRVLAASKNTVFGLHEIFTNSGFGGQKYSTCTAKFSSIYSYTYTPVQHHPRTIENRLRMYKFSK
jgi:hypothetical protein